MTSPIDTASVEIVPDFSGFGRKVSAGIDAALRGVVGDVRSAFDTVERAASSAGADVGREFQQGGERAESALREISTTAKREFREVEVSAAAAGSGLRTNLAGALGFVRSAMLGLTVAAGAGLVAMTGFGLKSAAQLEQVQVAFDSLLGSAEKGAAVFKDLQQFAAATPFEFPEVAGAAQRFLAFNDAVGLSDDSLRPFLTTLGDVASVTGGGAQALNSVTLAMGQIASSGKLTLDNLNQISEALPGFSGVAAIASATGKTTAQVMQEISAGSIDATTGIQALLVGMQKFPGAAGAMEKQSQTLLGVFSTFKDTLSQALVAGFAPVLPAIKDALSAATPLLGDAIAKIAPALGSALSAILPLIATVVSAISPILKPLIDGIGVFVRTAGETGGLQQLGDALGQVAKAMMPLFPVLGDLVGALAVALIPAIESLIPQLPEIVDGMVQVLNAITPILPALGFMIASIVELGKVFPGLFSLISKFADLDLSKIGEAFANIPGKVGAALAALPGILGNAAKAAFDFFFNAVGFGIGTIVKFFVDLPTTITTLVTDLWTRVKAIFTEGVNNAVTTATGLPGRILDALKALPGQMVQMGRNIISGLIDGIKASIGRAIDTVKRAMADIVNGAKKALGIASPSTVFADAVGAQIPAGIEQGIQSGVPSLSRLLGDITAPTTVNAGASSGAVFGAGSVVVQFTGAVPTTSEARRVGQTVGASIAATLQRRNIATAVRSL